MKLEQINTDFGRYYRVPGGVIYPSVTTVLASIPNPALEAWKEAVGPEKAAAISKQATTTGQRLHTYCEDWLNGKRPKLDIFDREMFRGIEDKLKLIQPYAIEKMMYSKALRSAGTMDVFGKYDGTLAIIDFKTTSRQKFSGDYDSYWLQTACYAGMIYEHTGVLVKDLFLIFQDLNGFTSVDHELTVKWLHKYKEVRDAFADKSHLIK